MVTGYKRIKILNDAEISDLYSLPKFTLEERVVFFSLSKKEKLFIQKIPDLSSKVHATLQLGYFKAKGRLFSFKYQEVAADLNYILTQYFDVRNHESILLKAKKADNNKKILALLNFRDFDNKTRKELTEHALLLARIHANHIDIFRELLSHIQIKQILLPDYTVLQDIITLSITIEIKRIENILRDNIPQKLDIFLSSMTQSNSTINFSTLKIEPKNFKYSELKAECTRCRIYSEYYKLSKQLIDKLEISPKCIRYYASIADEYNIYRLEQLSKPQSNLYLLCYINQRYKEIINNLVTSFIYHNNNFIQEANQYAHQQLILHTIHYNSNLPKVSSLLRFMGGGDAEQIDHTNFWKSAYDILPKTQYLPTADYIAGQSFDFEAAKWEFYVNKAKRIKSNIRMLFRSIEFCGNKNDDDLIQAISFVKDVFNKETALSKIAAEKFPDKFIPKNIRKYLYISNVKGTVDPAQSCEAKQTSPTSGTNINTTPNLYHPDKYEFYLYQSIVKEIDKGNIFCNESTKYKSLSADLISDQLWKNKDELIRKLNYPNIAVDIKQRLDELETKLHRKILEVNRKIASKENTHIKIKDVKDKDVKSPPKWHLINPTVDEKDDDFFAGIPNINISDLLYFINEQTGFCEAFDHIKPRYAKQKADYEGIIACIVANGFSFGTYRMAQSCDISYSTLSNIEKNFLSLENLREANDIITNKIASLKVFNSWNIATDILLAAIDGQKYETRIDTTQARHSPKYFGLKKGVVSFSMVLNHVSINCKIIGANEHESHYTYDIIYNNTSDVDPDAISGDMHSINKVNFAVLDSISKLFMPNFSNPEEQVKSLRCMKSLSLYKDCFIKPNKIINKKLIIEEWENIQRIFVSLATQESTQATIISKLSSHKRYSKIKTALWEYDAILKSLYLLTFIDDEILRSQIRKALNRVEAYHQLRRAIAKVHSGKFRGQTILENEIWNQCSRFLANSIILYNAQILDKLLSKCTLQGNIEEINYLNSISPVRWQHINFIGKYEFTQAKTTIKIDDIVAQLKNNLKKL